MKAVFERAKVIVDGEDTYLCLSIPRRDAAKFVGEMKPRKYAVEIKEYRKKRSLDANAYAWTLIGKLAAVLSTKEAPVTPDNVYRDCIRDVGDNYDVIPVKEDRIEYWNRIWCAGHIGRFTEDLGPCRSSGLKVVDYESGHRDHVDVAVRRAVMTGVSQICAKYTEQSAEYLDTPYFEVSAHIGARDKPGPSPWSSHKEWQGKVYSARAGDIYPNIYEVCGLGAVDGLEGANCRHRRFPWVEGVSERTYTDEQLEHIDDGHGCTFDGKDYTAYEATQMQRRIERTVRKLKREKAAYKAAGLTEDATVANIKLRRLNAKYREFSKAAGLPEQKERLKVLYGGQLADSKKFAPLKEYAGAWKIKDKFSDRQYIIDVGKPQISGAKQHFWDNLDTRPDRSGLNLDAAQDIINNSRLTLYQTDKSAIKFLSDNGYTVINMKKEVITVVPEKLRKKYRDYLEGK